MPSRRAQITMTEDELRAFLAEQRIMQLATIGPSGRPHVVPLWYVPDGLALRGWTYAKSQKARNIERDPRATIAIETGVQYHEMRGAMLECDVEVERDPERVAGFGMALVERYVGDSEDAREAFRAQVPKRVGLRFLPTRTVTWDHRKLGGVY